MPLRYAAIVLLDELEKAHKVMKKAFLRNVESSHSSVWQDVSMILLQILDEGNITDSQGRRVDFKVIVPSASL